MTRSQQLPSDAQTNERQPESGRLITVVRKKWAWFLITALVAMCVLSFYEPSKAAQPGKQPFRNPVSQRQEMISELKAIRLLVKEQNQLLRSIHQQNAKTKPR